MIFVVELMQSRHPIRKGNYEGVGSLGSGFALPRDDIRASIELLRIRHEIVPSQKFIQ